MGRRITIREERITLGENINVLSPGDRVFIYFWEKDYSIDFIVIDPKSQIVGMLNSNKKYNIIKRKNKNFIIHAT